MLYVWTFAPFKHVIREYHLHLDGLKESQVTVIAIVVTQIKALKIHYCTQST